MFVGYCFHLFVLKLDWEWAYLVVHYWVLVCEVIAFLYDCLLVWLEVATGVGSVGVDFSAGSSVGYFVYLLVGLVVVFQVSLLLD